jgi:hypothetical protein
VLVQLPDDSIGASDLLGWRECPARFAFQMRRHNTLPDGRKDEPPESINWTTAYGSCVHEAIHLVTKEGLSNDAAIDQVWPEFAAFLDPGDLALLHEDLDALRADTPLGWELVASEAEMKVPLFVHEGRQIYFRFRLDQLWRRIDEPTVFMEKDFKSSKHRKTQEEVDKDVKCWAYNWAVHELFPETQSLLQIYCQLRFGDLNTSKNAEQRKQVKAWLIKTAKAVLADEKLDPKLNQWCPWCQLVADCDVTKRAGNYWKERLAVLAPRVKEGRKTVIQLPEGKDLERMIRETLPVMVQSRKQIEAAEKALKVLIGDLPLEKREELGWRLADRKSNTFSPEALRIIHEALGARFYEVITLSKTAVDVVVGKPTKGEPLPPVLQVIENVQLKKVSSTSIEPA